MKLSFLNTTKRSFLPLVPVFFVICLILSIPVLFLASRFAYENARQSLSASVDAQAQSQLPGVQLENLERLENRLDPAVRLKWESRAKQIQPQVPQP